MPKCGSLNWVIFLCFQDGVEWVFRSPKSGLDSFYSDETTSKILVSEASTLLYFKTNTSIPVPQVFSYSGSSDNDIGIPYILQSKATGRSLGSYAWSPPRYQVPGLRHRSPPMPISDHDRGKVMSQLGAFMSELSAHRFDRIGSLFRDGDTNYAVGECLSPSLTWQERDSLELDRGPFNNEHDYLASLISAFTSHAKELSLTPHTFFAPVPDMVDYESLSSYQKASRRWNDFVAIGQKIEHSKNILFYCLTGQFLSEMVNDLSSDGATGFTISHPDLHLGNIYVDENFNITSIIDWSSASTGPVSEILAAPSLGNSAAPPSVFLAASFRSGFIQEATQKAQDLPDGVLWKRSERMWYFTRLTRLLSKNDYQLFERLFELIYEKDAFVDGKERILGLFHERASRDENVKLLAKLQEDDLSAEELQEKERACFPPKRTVNTDSIAVARKLTLMSEMNPLFLADHRLWKWVEEAREQDELR
ncbi:kinase-like domain-containing protein [Fusarium circinatum]|uniref:Kinase-like domain-containing protein n=1 Tax=Fusarium circinatum TaxID=48490 RepID=A0A8H5WRH1_FUSCI|nr:kinase-like domain-containing protein [Fusarium circinatum]